MEGWVKLYRQLLDKAIWKTSTSEQKTILITLLLMTWHKEKEWEWHGIEFKTKPGQFVTSLDSIKKNAGDGISIQNIRTALSRFQKLKFLTNESTKTGRLITILNWDTYQSENNLPNKDTNKQVTKSQQRPNKDLTPNNNDKNVKNVKKVYIHLNEIYPDLDTEHVSLTQEEHDKLVNRFGVSTVRDYVTRLNNYIGSKGKKYKSHYHTILTWHDKDAKEHPEQFNQPKEKVCKTCGKAKSAYVSGGQCLDCYNKGEI